MVDVSSKKSMNWWGGEELDVHTSVISACQAWLTFVADNIGFNCNSISNLKMSHRRVNGKDYTCRFVTENVCICYDHGPDTSGMWRDKIHIISSVPRRKPRTFVDDASEYLSAGVSNAFSFLSGGSAPMQARPDEVFDGDIDLNDDEVLEQEKGEEAEVDDSPDLIRRLHMISMSQADLDASGPKAQMRRQFEILPLRRSIAMRGSSYA